MLLGISEENYLKLEEDVLPDDDLLRRICTLLSWNYQETRQKLLSRHNPLFPSSRPPLSYEEMLESAEPVEPVEVPEVSAPKLLTERLREAREKVSQTIEGMALLLQVSPEYYEQIEEGKTIPEEELLKRIASLFEWNYHELLEEDRRSRFIHFQSSDRPLGIRSRSDSERELNEVLRIIREGWNELRPDQQRSLLNQLELIRDTLQLWQGMVSRLSEEPSDT